MPHRQGSEARKYRQPDAHPPSSEPYCRVPHGLCKLMNATAQCPVATEAAVVAQLLLGRRVSTDEATPTQPTTATPNTTITHQLCVITKISYLFPGSK